MGTIQTLTAAQPFERETFKAWRLPESNPRGEAVPIEVSATSLQGAVEQAQVRCHHKDHLIVLATDHVRPRAIAHFYAVKRESRARYRWNSETQINDRWHKEYAAPLFAMQVLVDFAPVEPWEWSPEADPVGRDDVIEQRLWGQG